MNCQLCFASIIDGTKDLDNIRLLKWAEVILKHINVNYSSPFKICPHCLKGLNEIHDFCEFVEQRQRITEASVKFEKAAETAILSDNLEPVNIKLEFNAEDDNVTIEQPNAGCSIQEMLTKDMLDFKFEQQADTLANMQSSIVTEVESLIQNVHSSINVRMERFFHQTTSEIKNLATKIVEIEEMFKLYVKNTDDSVPDLEELTAEDERMLEQTFPINEYDKLKEVNDYLYNDSALKNAVLKQYKTSYASYSPRTKALNIVDEFFNREIFLNLSWTGCKPKGEGGTKKAFGIFKNLISTFKEVCGFQNDETEKFFKSIMYNAVSRLATAQKGIKRKSKERKSTKRRRTLQGCELEIQQNEGNQTVQENEEKELEDTKNFLVIPNETGA